MQPQPSRKEHPSTYFVPDRSNEQELTRLRVQDRMITTGMGGVLPEQADPTIFHRVLDVGCGTGGWLIEAAKTYPTMSLLVGADISGKMLAYAREQAKAQQVDNRVEFHSMDALRMLEFPSGSFDLVNQRLGTSYLRTFDWPKLLQEYQRVTVPGGTIRITEANTTMENNSPALTKIIALAHEANHRSGRLFHPRPDGLIMELAHLMTLHKIQNVQTQEYHLVYRAGTPQGQSFYEDMVALCRVGLPFLQKWTRVPDDYDDIYQQALKEMQQPDFVATWTYLTAWGTCPE